jgi:transcriptional regulator with XRE-family HTH domain
MEDDTANESRSLGTTIRTAREAKGLSIRSLARTANTDHTLVSRIEAGKVLRPAVELLERFADVLEIDPSTLLEKVGIKPRLPEPRMYFRSAFGVSDEEAGEMLKTLEKEHGSKLNHRDKAEGE